ncbi:hypothetical protein BHE74_00040828 [Ensete ventricosum]|nr:hypothetical protein BHE74_00040828 [Ensete ventricosum]
MMLRFPTASPPPLCSRRCLRPPFSLCILLPPTPSFTLFSLSTFTFCSVQKHCGLTKSKQISLLPNAHDSLPRLFRHQQLLTPHQHLARRKNTSTPTLHLYDDFTTLYHPLHGLVSCVDDGRENVPHFFCLLESVSPL